MAPSPGTIRSRRGSSVRASLMQHHGRAAAIRSVAALGAIFLCVTRCSSSYPAPTEDPAPTCLNVGDDCSSGEPCCAGTCAGGGDPPHYACEAPCMQNSDCPTGCCTPITGTTVKGCGARGFCKETCGVR